MKRPLRLLASFRRLALPRRFRLAAVLALTFGGLVLVSTAAVMILEWYVARRVVVEFLNETVQASIEDLERGVRSSLDPTRAMVDDLAGLMIAGRLPVDDPAMLENRLATALAGRKEVSAIVVINPEGRATIATRRQGQIGFDTEDWRGRPDSEARMLMMRSRRETFWGDIVYGDDLRQPIINVRRAVYDGDTLLGYVGAGVTIGQLSTLVDALALEGPETPFILFGRDRVLAHPQLVDLGERLWPSKQLPGLGEVDDPVLAGLWDGQALPAFDRSKRFGINVSWVQASDGNIVAVKPFPGYGEVLWTVGLYVPGSLLTDSLVPLRNGAIIAVGLLLLALAMALLLGRLVAWPIRAATEGAARISELALADIKPLPPSRISELDQQAQAFNAMLAGIKAFETYVPRSLVHRLMRAGRLDAIVSVQRDMTVMFTDIVGFTTASEQFPARQVAEFLNDHFALLARCVEDEGGTVDKFLGDGLMAFWGAPEKLKDRAARACRAALAIRDALERENQARLARGRVRVRVRIGLHRGPLIVGNIGSPGRINYTVVGDVANVAQRLEQLGRDVMANETAVILVSQAVVEDAGPAFTFRRLGPMPVRGRQEPVIAYRLEGPAGEIEPQKPLATAATS